MSAVSANFAQLRRAMVDNQVRPFSVTDRAVLARMLETPREIFLPAELLAIAYSDLALEVSLGTEHRRMLSAMVLARMIQTAAIQPSDRILDVGGGLGYSAAVMAGLGAEVTALETGEAMTRTAAVNFARAGLANCRAVNGPLEAGFAAGAPYNVIFLNGLIETAPEALLAQLADGGRLLAIRTPANDPAGRSGRAVRFEKTGNAIGAKEIFDASAPVLPGFRAVAAFAF